MKKILIADDSSLFRKLVSVFFAKKNEFELVYTTSYKESVELLELDNDFFVAIVCIVLPDALDGEMVDLSLSHKIPTLVLTSSFSKDIIHQMSTKPIIDYVSKKTKNDIEYAVELIHTLNYFVNKKVLVVTDDLKDASTVSSYISTLLLRPIHTSNAKDALTKLDLIKDIDIIITDNNISDMEGVKLVQAIRNKYSREQKIILSILPPFKNHLSSLYIKYGVNEVITKPLSKEEFNAKIFKELDYKKKIEEVKGINETVEHYVITSITDENGIIRDASEAFCKASGYTKEELIGQSQNIVRHPDTPSEVFQDLWNTIESGKRWAGILKNKKKDGSHYWVEAHIEPIFNSEGSITGYRAVRQNITAEKEVEEKNKQIEYVKKNITDSIKFSSLIQHALLPENEVISRYFSDFFILWEPKDIVGGDIYLFMYRPDSCLFFVIDCTGHGVPGAFMTIITKNILHSTVNDTNFNNPGLILKQLSKNIQKTLRQDNPNSKSDAGLDGGVIHYNRKTKKILYAGAKTPLFYIQNGEMKVIKGDRESIGYKKSNIDFEFKNHEIDLKGDSYFYITTDGYIDQNGGKNGFVFGKKRTQDIILKNYKKDFSEQKDIFYKHIVDYQGDHERDDDINFFGFSVMEESDEKVEHFFKYNGYLTQDILGEIEEELEEKHRDIFLKTNKKEKVYTVLYELGQNVIQYGVDCIECDLSVQPYIEIEYDIPNDKFIIICKNKIFNDSIETIKSRIDEANSVSKDDIKDIYRELRKNQKYSHDDNAGLGFFEFAKRSLENMKYSFDSIDSKTSLYTIKIII